MADNTFVQQVENAVRVTTISRTLFSWFGKPIATLPRRVSRVLSPQLRDDYVLSSLQNCLYENFYCLGDAKPQRWNDHRSGNPVNTMAFVQALSAANCGSGCIDTGWRVRSVENGQVQIARNGLLLRVRSDDCRLTSEGPFAENQQVSLRLPKEQPCFSPGFFVAIGNQPLTAEDWLQAVRLYWNSGPTSAIELVRRVTMALNREELPFHLKILNDLERSSRCDAVVLYIRKSDYDEVRPILESIQSELRHGLRPSIPAFTKRLADGIGLAEEPCKGTSFGAHRCQILAEGIVAGKRKKHLSARLQVALDRFAENGVDVERPYLRPDSEDIYRFRTLRGVVHQAPPQRGLEISPPAPAEYIETARAIGRQLCTNAVWNENRCTWLGASLDSNQHPTYGTIGPDLYGGTSGIGLFLAELSAVCEDEPFARGARGAIRQAFYRADAIMDRRRLGLFTGWPGIALAATRIGALLDDDEIQDQARGLLRQTMREHRSDSDSDLIAGRGGAIVALLQLRRRLDDSTLFDFAIRLGEELLETAHPSAVGTSWKSINASNEWNLTGFSHGAAGIGYALLELFAATGDLRYRQAGQQAFDYERSWFDPQEGNWPDLRGVRCRKAGQPVQPPFVSYWCHGAPGIALSRLRASNILNDCSLEQEMHLAFDAAAAAVDEAISSHEQNYCLCHGLAGNAEVLLIGQQQIGAVGEEAERLAAAVADNGIERYARPIPNWPCGNGQGSTPGLMLGLAGTGYFYLRMFDRTTPSVLLLEEAQPVQSSATDIESCPPLVCH